MESGAGAGTSLGKGAAFGMLTQVTWAGPGKMSVEPWVQDLM